MYFSILYFVREILCSPKWQQSIDIEMRKTAEKTKNVFVKVCRAYKISSPGMLPIVPDIISTMRKNIGRTRHVVVASQQVREQLAQFCAKAIHKHILLLDHICKGVITPCKLRNATTGLLYIMRGGGINIHGVVVLQKCPELAHVLPQESHLQEIWGCKCKCIVESENIVKIVLRSLTRDDLVKLGTTSLNSLPFH